MIKKLTASVLSFIMIFSLFCMAGTSASAAGSTGVGLAEHALNAYYSGWRYVYGGSSAGAVDCSGLIMTYNGVGGIRTDMLAASSARGYVSNGIPRIHGLGLHQPGHVGVYIGNGMAVDARNEYSGICYESVYSHGWTSWFKVAGVSYPTTGWVSFNGNTYYYEDGQYVVSTTRVLDGVTYTFGSDGTVTSGNAPEADSSISYSGSSVTDTWNYDTYDSGAAAAAAAAAEEKAKKEEEEKKKKEEEEQKRKEAEQQIVENAVQMMDVSIAAQQLVDEESAVVVPQFFTMTEDGQVVSSEAGLLEEVALTEDEIPRTAAGIPEESLQSTASQNENQWIVVFGIVMAVLASCGTGFYFLNRKFCFAPELVQNSKLVCRNAAEKSKEFGAKAVAVSKTAAGKVSASCKELYGMAVSKVFKK